MKSKTHLVAGLLLTMMVACTPKNEEVTEEQVEVAPQREALDSIADTRKDALRTDENEISPNLPMPQPVMQLLTQRYPGWEQPTLTDGAIKRAQAYEQGPTVIRGDFNSDTRQDYALQLQQDKDVVILAILDGGDGNWNVYELKRDILFNERGTLKSLYYLFLTEQGEELPDSETDAAAPHDAISVGIENKTTTYVFQENDFTEYGQSI
ncbi:MAG: hypothetical protein LPK07_04735 [Hymenobacteraceae bacterium]|nr:hypothetical protein [Hymenobacteraceae bacterium]MDX5480967.1 hypothetical protein [Hymenobacteraceae bacterium]